jgi:predicted HAD superfamily Cof-like phosphohydrolase
MKTNFAKIDPETGAVRRREDGKIMKPDGWKAPELAPFLTKVV